MKKSEDQIKKIEHLEAQIEEWKAKYMRALADYQNLEKRKSAEAIDIRKFAAEVLLERFLPVMDTFQMAQKHLKDQGLALALKEAEAFLKEYGVEKIEVIGQDFDPHKMECIEVIDGQKNIVIEEARPGYILHDKVLRVAQVKVGKSKNL